jgi:protein-disulfide isomerase
MSCAGPLICRLAVVAPRSCSPLDAHRGELLDALSRGSGVGDGERLHYLEKLLLQTGTVVVDADVRKARVFPCGRYEWLSDASGPWQQPQERRRLLYHGQGPDPCTELRDSAEIEIVVDETPCFDTSPAGVAELLGLRSMRRWSTADAASSASARKISERPGFVLGDSTAPVAITAFTTYRCGFDDLGTDPIPAVRERFGDKVRVAYRTLVPQAVVGKAPDLLVRAALAAARQGRREEYMRRTPAFPQSVLFDADAAVELARRLEIDAGRFANDLAKPSGAYVGDVGGGIEALEVYTSVHRFYADGHDLTALAAARAAIAAGRQGRFWEMRRWLVAHCADLDRRPWNEAATALELDARRFAEDMESPESLQLIAEDLALAESLEILGDRLGTVLFVNGKHLPSSWPLDLYPELISDLR